MGLVFTSKDMDVIVLYRNLKRMASYVDMINNHSHNMWKRLFFVFKFQLAVSIKEKMKTHAMQEFRS